jgi:hypothetical protein
MADWCLHGEANDSSYRHYPQVPVFVIVNVPEETLLTKEDLARRLRKLKSKGHLGFLENVSENRWTLTPLAQEISAELRKGFKTFGLHAVEFYNWQIARDDGFQMKAGFARRHPDLMSPFEKYEEDSANNLKGGKEKIGKWAGWFKKGTRK